MEGWGGGRIYEPEGYSADPIPSVSDYDRGVADTRSSVFRVLRAANVSDELFAAVAAASFRRAASTDKKEG